MAVKYLPSNQYKLYLERLIEEKQSFKIESTNYTKKIKKGNDSIIFNDDGEGDMGVLSLISMVRSDARQFINKNQIPEDIRPDFFDLVERPPLTEVTKVDIRGAYWNYALKTGIISKETDQFLNDTYTGNEKLKKARLKALGSLATCKKYFSYINGEQVEYEEKTQETYGLYLFICAGIDEIMREITATVPGAFYYYWDCVFVAKEASQEVIDFIKKKKYSVKVEDTIIETVKILNKKYLFCQANENMYMIKKEKEFMLPQANKQYSPIYFQSGQLQLLY